MADFTFADAATLIRALTETFPLVKAHYKLHGYSSKLNGYFIFNLTIRGLEMDPVHIPSKTHLRRRIAKSTVSDTNQSNAKPMASRPKSKKVKVSKTTEAAPTKQSKTTEAAPAKPCSEPTEKGLYIGNQLATVLRDYMESTKEIGDAHSILVEYLYWVVVDKGCDRFPRLHEKDCDGHFAGVIEGLAAGYPPIAKELVKLGLEHQRVQETLQG